MDKNDDNEISYEEFRVWFNNFLDYGSIDQQTRDTTKIEKTKDDDDNKVVNGYTFINKLGQGSFGKVSLVLHQTSNKGYALKTLNKAKLKTVKVDNNHTALDALYEEVKVMKLLKHPNILKLYEVMDDPQKEKIYLLVEFCEKGIAMDIRKEKSISEELSRKLFIDLLLGVEYMHKMHVIHRDIKPENILVDSTGKGKIADFGTARILDFGFDTIKIGAGTPAFASPESTQINPEYSGKISDIWACAVTLYCFITGKLPFEGDNITQIYSSIQEKEPNYDLIKSKDLIDLLKKMLTKDVSKRLVSIPEIKKHSWFKDTKDWDQYDADKSINYYHNDKFKPSTPTTPTLGSKFSFNNSFKNSFRSVSENEELPPQMQKKVSQMKK